MSDKKTENGNGSFWTTIPGCLTGIAALITAVGGLIAILYSVGIFQPPSTLPSNPPPTQMPVTDTVAPPLPACVPSLISPQTDAILDNGRTDRLDNMVWEFDWSDCPGATEYHLYVIGPTAPNPSTDNSMITSSSYQDIQIGSFIGGDPGRFNWTWKVRARVNDQWGEWSETRVFNVEPVDTDPASP